MKHAPERFPQESQLKGVRGIKGEIPATPLEPPDRRTSELSAFIGVHRRPVWGLHIRLGPGKNIWPPMNADERR
jgi:hypothetical protein